MSYETASHHILLVDDNTLDIDLFEQATGKTASRIQLDIAKDGEQALAYLKELESGAPIPVVILLDMKIPKVDSLGILRALKSHPRLKTIPVVALTSSNETEDIRQVYDLGANSYIVKPADDNEFAKAVVLIQRYWCRLNIYLE